MRCLPTIERLLFIFGLLMLGIYLGARAYTAVSSRATVETFKREQLRSPDQNRTIVLAAAQPDFSLWSPKRIKEYEDSLATYFTPAIGILRIPKIHVEVPVLDGTDELSLNRGVGRIAGTASPGQEGNIGIAGHRDSFFRGLKDVALGDTVEVVTQRRIETYIIDNVVIVDPHDTSVLQARQRPSLTLVTCYPFHFVGSAPRRYIVQASLADSDAGTTRVMERSNADTNNFDQLQRRKEAPRN
jgi:sortase A